MRRVDTRGALAVLALAASGCASSEDTMDMQADTGSDVYANCGACHLPTGEGVPGAFPPLRNRVADIASASEGREYLIAVVLDGLSGSIDVSGVTYFGFMQPHRQALDDEQISAVLNYIMFELADTPPKDVSPFRAGEVSALRQQRTTESVSPLKLRQALDSE